MKICKNCGTTNDDAAVACQNCRRKGKFESLKTPTDAARNGEVTPSVSAANCGNCGQPITDAHAEHCPHCRRRLTHTKRSFDLLDERVNGTGDFVKMSEKQAFPFQKRIFN